MKFTNDEGVKVLARSLAGDPLLAIIERPGQKVLLLTVNLDEGDLPLRTAFPILMMNALNWFTENRGELREALPTGAITEVDLAVLRVVGQPFQADPNGSHGIESKPPAQSARKAERSSGQPGKADLRLVAPDGRRSALPLSSERLSLGPFDQCGVWRVVAVGTKKEEADTTLLELACNLSDRNESDVRVPKSNEGIPTTMISASLLGNRPVWFWLIALAWLLMTIEWWAYQRRVIT